MGLGRFPNLPRWLRSPWASLGRIDPEDLGDRRQIVEILALPELHDELLGHLGRLGRFGVDDPGGDRPELGQNVLLDLLELGLGNLEIRLRRLDSVGFQPVAQEERVLRLFTAARRNDLELLLEVIPSKVGPVDDDTTAALIRQFYEAGVRPDWWKLEPFRTEAAWARAVDAIERNDPRTRGIVVLGLDAPKAELAECFELAARQPLARGFAVGRTIFGDVARAWFKGETGDDEAVAEMAGRYAELCEVWDAARARAGG